MGGERKIAEEIVTACKILDAKGLVEGYGHVSVRMQGTNKILITPRMAPGLIKASNLVMVELSGKMVRGTLPAPYELPMHTEVYKARKDVNAIVRTHSPYSTVFGVTGRSLKPIHGFGSFVGADIPIFMNPELISTEELGRELAEKLGSAEAVLLRGNGNLVVGRTLHESLVKALFLEDSAMTHYRALSVGEPLYYNEDEIRRRTNVHYDHYARAWDYYKKKFASR